MGMSIGEAIRYYEDKNVVLTEEEALANTIALNVMRKYQKIQEIVSSKTTRLSYEDGFRQIREVIENEVS